MANPFTDLLDPAVQHGRVESAIRKLWNGRERTSYGLCLGLRRLFRDQVHRGTGRSRFVDWVEQRSGIPTKLAGLFSWLGSKLEELTLTLQAMESGEVTYTKLREYVTLATRENEAEWIEFASTHTNREIEARVRRKQREDGTETTKIVSELTPEERQAARKAREKLQKKKGKSIRPAKLFAEMARAIAEGTLESAADNGRKRPPAPYVSFQPCPICLDTFVPVPEGLLRVPTQDLLEAIRRGAEVFVLTGHFFCDCEDVKHRRDRCPNWSLPDVPPPKNRHIPVEVLKRIHARDGFVCRTPVCGCEVPLEVGHLEEFAKGAPPILELLRDECSSCNDLIKTGRLRVVGHAPYERYYSADGEFLGFGYQRGSSHTGTGDGGGAPDRNGAERPPGSGGQRSRTG